MALNLQIAIAEAVKEASIKLFMLLEFGGPTEREAGQLFAAKASVQDQLKALGIP